MDRTFALAGAVFAFLAVASGAFGAHALRGRLPDGDLDTFEIAVRYQMYHALALILLSYLTTRWPGGAMTLAGWSFIVGIVVFSGSLYTLILSGERWLGAITPIGGLALLVGWAALAWRIVQN